MLVAFLLFTSMPEASLSGSLGKLHPSLAPLVTAQPEQMVRVIVQAAGSTDMASAMAGMGGEFVQDLSIIHASVGRIPARSLPALAALPSVGWISPDGPVQGSGLLERKGGPGDSGGTNAPAANTYLDTLGVRNVWEMGYQGQGIGIAVIDSGIASGPDFQATLNGGSSRILESRVFGQGLSANDNNGHGTHVAGIAAGNGSRSAGEFSGIAPMANLLSLNISDGSGMAYESDTVAAMQWVLDNKATYNIRVVNLSINSTVESSYHSSPMNAAAEILWFNGIVVVASSGNKGNTNGPNTSNAAPANDPFLITVGAFDEMGDSKLRGDAIAPFTAQGWTDAAIYKPEILAPGANIWSVLAPNSSWGKDHPDRVDSTGKYFRASGTSMAAPMVAGAVALLLQKEPTLTPDQVKYRLINASRWVGAYPGLDVYKALITSTTKSANTGLTASQLLWTGSQPAVWQSGFTWSSVNWNSVNWNSVNWNSGFTWSSVNWNSTYFGYFNTSTGELSPVPLEDDELPMLFLPMIGN
ncbi:MAG: S8 family peptidase [Caldilineaceae bacterium]|nr:S8 family peptidase [Caldilineaceae bacterium]